MDDLLVVPAIEDHAELSRSYDPEFLISAAVAI